MSFIVSWNLQAVLDQSVELDKYSENFLTIMLNDHTLRMPIVQTKLAYLDTH